MKKQGLPDELWIRELQRLERRIRKVRAVLGGEATLTTVTRKGHWVKRYYVREHEMHLIIVKPRTRRKRR